MYTWVFLLHGAIITGKHNLTKRNGALGLLHGVKMANVTQYAPTDIITVLAPVNPKQQYNGRAGGTPAKAYQRFNLYKTGMSVAAYKALVAVHPAGGKGYAAADLAWDTKHGFISIANPANATAATPAPAETQVVAPAVKASGKQGKRLRKAK